MVGDSNKKVTRTVGGLIFRPKEMKGIHGSVEDWIKAGKPDNAYVYDHVDTLKVCGFPICDGAYVRGMYRRMPTIKQKKVEILLIGSFIRPLKPAEVKSKAEGIQVAETKTHHRMIY